MRRFLPLAVFATLSSGCWFDEPNAAVSTGNGPGQTPPSQRATDPGEVEVRGTDASKLSAMPLDACERFERYSELARSTEKLDEPLREPEWQLHGHRIATKGGRLTVAWAEGYGEADETAPQPVAHPWWACSLPSSMTEDIAPLSFGAAPMPALSMIDLKLMDEGDSKQRGMPRREYATVIDTRARTVAPRVLCRMESASDGCSLARSCGVDRSSGKLVAQPWPEHVSASCRPLLQKYGKPSDMAVGPLGASPPPAAAPPSTLPGGWL